MFIFISLIACITALYFVGTKWWSLFMIIAALGYILHKVTDE